LAFRTPLEQHLVNCDELTSAIDAIGISDRLVAVRDHAEYAWCVVRSDDGAWEVFWGERGNKNDLETFASEHQACAYLLGRLTYSQILAGLTWGDTR
jgi:hypothetical protein